MAENSLFPAFVKIFYTTQFAQHVMSLPTRAYVTTAIGVEGDFSDWNDNPVSPTTMVTALATQLADLYAVGECTFDTYEVFSLATPTSPPVWQWGNTLGIAGTLVAPVGWREAVQSTYTFRTSLGGIARLVLLDRPTANNFGRITTLSAAEQDIVNELFDDTNAWAGRDGGQFSVFKNQTITLNERLRREYGIG